jgi:hypothetical protein
VGGNRVRKFLTVYLLVTGIGAAVALAMPGLVVLGFFLLILPGLVLSFAPTAFLWGCLFTASWLAARGLFGDTLLTVFAAGAVTAVALIAVTIPNRTAGEAAYRASLLPDIAPSRRIAMKGDIRLDLPRPRWDNINSRGKPGQRGFSCDNLCLALLFTPDVTSVTINNSSRLGAQDHRMGTGGFDPEARTYRLVPKSQCPDGGLLPDLTGASGLFGGKLEEGKALNAEWNLKLANEVCLTRSAPIDRHDILVRRGSYGGPIHRATGWSLAPREPSIEHVEIRDAEGSVSLRRFKSSVPVLSRLLHIMGEGGIENFRFGWGTTTISNKPKYGEISLLRELEAHTTTVGKVSGKDLLPAMRVQLRTALADRTIAGDAPAFQVLPAYFDALPNPLPPEDLAIVSGLARDDRISRYEGIWNLNKLPIEQQAIRNALVERALSTDMPAKLSKSAANHFLDKMPGGSFAVLTADEEQLLARPQQRWAMPSLVARLNEGGPTRVPLLLSIMREHSLALRKNHEDTRARRIGTYEKSQENDGHRSMMQAARTALCRLGPSAPAALQPLEDMLTSGIIGENEMSGHNGVSWDVTLARLGKPIEQLKKPARLSGTDEAHRQRIRKKLERFDPNRNC